MVLLAVAVCNKSGKALVSRQFVEMTRSRIEGLLAAFPKLMGTGKQHTFVETESVRYVYQPLEKLYMLLITTKASNILEDLETLRLFAKVIPEYCKAMEESEIIDQSFPLIFAFDEVVALGYRENVNIAQIRTFTEMDSHEERVFQAVRESQEREAKENAKRKSRELEMQRKLAAKQGRKAPTFGGYAGGSAAADTQVITDMTAQDTPKPAYARAHLEPSKSSTRAMKLGSKTKDVDVFVDQLKSEGERVASDAGISKTVQKVAVSTVPKESIHLRMEEKISVTAGRDSGLQNLELLGLLTLKVTSADSARIVVDVEQNDSRGFLMQTHPNIDKKLFTAQSRIGLKNPEKPFPLNQDVGVLKWRFQTQDEAHLPLSINCWPTENSSGCEVNIEYELEQGSMELKDVRISVPLPASCAPVVSDCDGDYSYDSRRSVLLWTLALIDASNRTGTLEFTTSQGRSNDFFPVNVQFASHKSFCNLQVTDVIHLEGNAPAKYSDETLFFAEKYEIV